MWGYHDSDSDSDSDDGDGRRQYLEMEPKSKAGQNGGYSAKQTAGVWNGRYLGPHVADDFEPSESFGGLGPEGKEVWEYMENQADNWKSREDGGAISSAKYRKEMKKKGLNLGSAQVEHAVPARAANYRTYNSSEEHPGSLTMWKEHALSITLEQVEADYPTHYGKVHSHSYKTGKLDIGASHVENYVPMEGGANGKWNNRLNAEKLAVYGAKRATQAQARSMLDGRLEGVLLRACESAYVS